MGVIGREQLAAAAWALLAVLVALARVVALATFGTLNRTGQINTLAETTLLAAFLATFFLMGGSVMAQSTQKFPQVRLETTLGAIVVEINTERAPKTAENFLAYVKAGHYDGTIFHRVIPGFMIQGGGMDEKFQDLPSKAPVTNKSKGEIGRAHV